MNKKDRGELVFLIWLYSSVSIERLKEKKKCYLINKFKIKIIKILLIY